MAQRIIGIGPDGSHTRKGLQNPADRRPLERIGFFVSAWERMNWYVSRLGQLDIEAASEGEILSLQEEFVALERTCFGHYSPKLPSRREIEELQQTVVNHFADLADKGVTTLPPLTRIATFCNPKVLAKQEGIKERTGIAIFDRFYMYSVPKVEPITHVLLHHLAQLLEQFQSSIRRCPHCSKVFLQFRRNAIYCGRACQSVAVMRKTRHKTTAPVRGTGSKISGKRRRRKGVNL